MWPEESPSSKTHKEDAQAQIAFSNDVNIPKGRSPERQPYCLIGNTPDTSTEKTPLESQEMPRKKRVWFSDSPATDKLRKFHTFYLNGNTETLWLFHVADVVKWNPRQNIFRVFTSLCAMFVFVWTEQEIWEFKHL